MKKAKRFVTRMTQKGADLSSGVIMIDRKRTDSPLEVTGFGFTANGAHSVLSGNHSVVLGQRKPEIGFETQLPVVLSARRRPVPSTALDAIALLAPALAASASVPIRDHVERVERQESFASRALLRRKVAEKIGRLTVHREPQLHGARARPLTRRVPVLFDSLYSRKCA